MFVVAVEQHTPSAQRIVTDPLAPRILPAGMRPAVLSFLATAATGSRLIFTFVRRDFFDGTNYYGAQALHRRFVAGGVWRFALEPSEVDGLLREYGWSEREQVGPAEYAERYLRPAGRDLAATEIERFVCADRR